MNLPRGICRVSSSLSSFSSSRMQWYRISSSSSSSASRKALRRSSFLRNTSPASLYNIHIPSRQPVKGQLKICCTSASALRSFLRLRSSFLRIYISILQQLKASFKQRKHHLRISRACSCIFFFFSSCWRSAIQRGS